MTRSAEALSLDLDGLVVWRPPYQMAALGEVDPKLLVPPAEVPNLDRTVARGLPKPGEIASLLWHFGRPVFPDVARVIRELNPEEYDIYGNTGRRNREPMIALTNAQLRIGGVNRHFREIFFKPKGVTSPESKIDGINTLLHVHGYKKVRHLDDNGIDGLQIALYFLKRGLPVEVIVVEDLSSGKIFDAAEHKQVPNLRREATFRRGIQTLQ